MVDGGLRDVDGELPGVLGGWLPKQIGALDSRTAQCEFGPGCVVEGTAQAPAGKLEQLEKHRIAIRNANIRNTDQTMKKNVRVHARVTNIGNIQQKRGHMCVCMRV